MKSTKSRLLLFGLYALLLAAIILELSVRWLLPWNNYFAYNRRSIRLSEHMPNEDRTISRSGVLHRTDAELVRIRTDADGFILPDNRDPARSVDLTIAFFGGSTTESLWVKEDLRWPFLVGKNLSLAFGKNIRVLNVAVAGTNLQNSINAFVNKVMKHHPDIVVVMHVFNDCGLLITRHNYEDWAMKKSWGEEGILRSLYEISTSYSSALGLVRHFYSTYRMSWELRSRLNPKAIAIGGAREPRPPLDNKYASEYDLHLKLLVAMIRATGAIPVLMTEPSRDFGVDKEVTDLIWVPECTSFNQRVRRIARDERLPLIDLEEHVHDPALFFDVAHYNDRGSVLVADIVSAGLRELIARSLRTGVHP